MSEKPESEKKIEDTTNMILYKFLALHDRIMEERVELAKQSAHIEKVVKAFENKVNRFENLDVQVRQAWHDSVQSAAKQVGTTLGEEASRSAMENVSASMRKLQNGIDYMETWLKEVTRTAYFSFGQMLLTSVLVGASVGLLTVYLLR